MQYLALSQNKRKGFSLTELMITLFIFGIVMIASSDIFTTTFAGHRYIKNLQRDVEGMQFTMNALAKDIRDSTIVEPEADVTTNAQSLQFYQHAQGLCIQYRINNRTLEVAKQSSVSPAACDATTLSNFTTVSTGDLSGGFYVVPSNSSPRTVGRVTMTFRIQEDQHSAVMQTTVSLSDYGSAGSSLFQ